MFFKLILLALSAVVLLLILLSFEEDKPAQYWVFILVFTMVPGLTALLSVNDLLSLFVVIEFISLIAYILPILGNPNKQSGILASVKYYVLGAIASAIMLTGVIILATENGSFNFDEIQLNWMLGNFSTVQFAGIMLILCAFAIKVAVFPAYT
jgi:NADH:ubiquinone oxidoreductase subunit 2 (subunit N)